MPKTRNITRAQWSAANASHTSTRNRNENAVGYESEKENSGRHATRSQTRTHRRGALREATGVSTGSGKTATRPKATPKGKPTAAPVKEKKLPLQDITSHFLPAPEAANRGEGHEDDEPQNAGSSIVTALPPPPDVPLVRAPPAFTSPLPPSSPPSELTTSPVYRRQELPSKVLFPPEKSDSREAYDPWEEFEDARSASEHGTPTPAASDSDPFGFVALERKLKHERETATRAEDDEDLGLVLVADTSSPRPVRRLKRVHDEETIPEIPEGGSDDADPVVAAHPHYATPPTPHKDKQKRRRLSHEGHDIFSPCPSSVESSPSPSKISASKRPRPQFQEDPLEEFNEEVDRSFEVEAVLEAEHSDDAIAKHLRPRPKRHAEAQEEDEHVETKRSKMSKGKGVKKPVNKSHSATTKKQEKHDASDNEGDIDEKWERERLERVEYFKRLDEYHVEKEDVYLI